jgi:hypothetical protein
VSQLEVSERRARRPHLLAAWPTGPHAPARGTVHHPPPPSPVRSHQPRLAISLVHNHTHTPYTTAQRAAADAKLTAPSSLPQPEQQLPPQAAEEGGRCPFLAALPSPPPAQTPWYKRLGQLFTPAEYSREALGPHTVVESPAQLGLPNQYIMGRAEFVKAVFSGEVEGGITTTAPAGLVSSRERRGHAGGRSCAAAGMQDAQWAGPGCVQGCLGARLGPPFGLGPTFGCRPSPSSLSPCGASHHITCITSCRIPPRRPAAGQREHAHGP